MNLFLILKKTDKILLAAVFFLTLIGVLELAGMEQNGQISANQLGMQIASIGLGMLFMFGATLVNYRFFKNNSYAVIFLYGLSVLLLTVLLFVGTTAKGTTGWFRVAGFTFAPVEIVKIVLIILLAKYFSGRHIEVYRFFHLAVSFAYVALPGALVLLEPDLGSATILFSLWMVIMLFAGISKKHLILLLIVGLLIAGTGWFYALKDYQKNRIITFVNPYTDPQGAGYNAIQSMISVGDGGFFGDGLGYGSQIQFGFLPEAHTDFMFASVAEEFGFVGVVLVFGLLGIIAWRIMMAASAAENNFARIFCAGFLALIFIQVAINAGMNLGLMPITGITFPFLSYGGSSLISLFIGTGVVQSIFVNS